MGGPPSLLGPPSGPLQRGARAPATSAVHRGHQAHCQAAQGTQIPTVVKNFFNTIVQLLKKDYGNIIFPLIKCNIFPLLLIIQRKLYYNWIAGPAPCLHGKVCTLPSWPHAPNYGQEQGMCLQGLSEEPVQTGWAGRQEDWDHPRGSDSFLHSNSYPHSFHHLGEGLIQWVDDGYSQQPVGLWGTSHVVLQR